MSNNRVHEIDLLRFLAAMSVVFFHYAFRGHAADDMTIMSYPLLAPAARYGYLGVELFFMISGFVILMTATSASLKGFVISRVTRLYPAFWACCTLTFLITLAIGAPRYSATAGQFLLNLTMLGGFIGVDPIDGAYWSLFIELQFYVLVALVLVLRWIHKAELILGMWLSVTLVLEVFPVGVLRFLCISDYATFFIAGANCFLIRTQGITRGRALMLLVSWILAVVQSLADAQRLQENYQTPMNGLVVAGIVSAFYAMFVLIAMQRTGRIGKTRWLLMGVLTYPLYLLHQNIGFMIFNIAYPWTNAHLLFWGTIIVMLFAAYGVHVVVEKRLAPAMKVALSRYPQAPEKC